MRVYLLCRSILIECYESVEQVVTGSIIVVTTRVVWEVVAQGRVRQLLSEKIDLIQE